MVIEHIVIGSGLAALGTVLGLLRHPEPRIVVLLGPDAQQFLYYDQRRASPCAFLGAGGMGSHWHGVIPTGGQCNFAASADASFRMLFNRFYPAAALPDRQGRPRLFVPWRPIRPLAELRQLARQFGPRRLLLVPAMAAQVRLSDAHAVVVTSDGKSLTGRAWVAAGALHTPRLLAQTVAPRAARGQASDHVFCYVGQLHHTDAPDLSHNRCGVFHACVMDPAMTALYSLRPARFGYRQLDWGFQQREVFGMPTGSALAKLLRRFSPGLLAEALYNRAGLCGRSAVRSVYAQVPVADAYGLSDAPSPLSARPKAIHQATDAARQAQPFADLIPSQRPDLYLPGIHLHHTLDRAELQRAGAQTSDSPLQVVDASVWSDIGPEHHSFKVLVAAYESASGTLLETKLPARMPAEARP